MADLFFTCTIPNTGKSLFLSSLLTPPYSAIHHKYLIKNREMVSNSPLSASGQISQGWATWIHTPVVPVPLCSLCCDPLSVDHSVPDVRLKLSSHNMAKLHLFSCWQGPSYALPGRVSLQAGARAGSCTRKGSITADGRIGHWSLPPAPHGRPAKLLTGQTLNCHGLETGLLNEPVQIAGHYKMPRNKDQGSGAAVSVRRIWQAAGGSQWPKQQNPNLQIQT